MTYSKFKDLIYEQLSLIGKATSSPKRLELLDLLNQSPRTVETLSSLTNMSMANTSQHLKILINSRLLKKQKNGLYVTYRLSNKQVGSFVSSILSLAKLTMSEIDRLTQNYINQVPSYKMDDALKLMDKVDKGEIILIDVRPHEEFAFSHIPGAISIPLEELDESITGLTDNKTAVIYCRGPLCILSVEAVEKLLSKGYNALRLDQGMPEWESEDLPIAVG